MKTGRGFELAIIWLLHARLNSGYKSYEESQQKIVGGIQAREPIPYQVSIQIMINSFYGFGPKTWAHNCGGSIITAHHVLTAAHCLDKIDPSRISVVSGTNDLREKGSHGRRTMVSWHKIHPEYKELDKCDIGIVRVADAFHFDQKTLAIKYSNHSVAGGVDCLLTGWGFTMPVRVGKTPQDLQKATLRTITNEECINRGFPVNPTEICTFTRAGQGACGGDSGGPLVLKDEVVGVVSYGTRFCGTGSPDVFTRVSMFKEWIDATAV
ncbi:chymotrypsin-2-like [Uranotaenia lowii]|uniref:chymotrypsin-2-like n=1 Tax=Uranotaenia lowii TaxID=190385 RepID=UPI0024785F12|nr:chymotrypsin-2-like [Uranotaenia lowii]XP_055610371.1 chymotrypsin-2-like [Uranotaenia lowii]